MTLNTGLKTQTAGRLKRAQHYIGHEEFILTYGDGLADINLKELIAYHREHGKIATVTAVQPAGRFGLLGIKDDAVVSSFKEKLLGDGGWINGGFFVLKPEVFDYLPDHSDTLMWEDAPLEKLSQDNQLVGVQYKKVTPIKLPMTNPRWYCYQTYFLLLPTLFDKHFSAFRSGPALSR